MSSNGILQRSRDLIWETLGVTSGIDLPRFPSGASPYPHAAWWYAMVTRNLYRTNKHLRSVELLLRNECEDYAGANVLTRTIFEIAADLVYINQDVEARLSESLAPISFPTSPQNPQRPEAKVAGDEPTVPRRRWKPLSDICETLGLTWQQAYGDFYAITSVYAHGGSWALPSDYLELDGHAQPDSDKAEILYTALVYHVYVAAVTATVFPESISMRFVQELEQSCGGLGSEIASLRHSGDADGTPELG